MFQKGAAIVCHNYQNILSQHKHVHSDCVIGNF